jgi:ATP adenylyltransferase
VGAELGAGIATALRSRFAAALESGALEPIRTELHEIEDGGVRFAVRLALGLDHKPRPAARPSGANPFLPWDPALYVGELGPDHVCLLNKFPVLPDHALVVTRGFAEQEDPIEAADLLAVWSVLGELGGLAFYNAGAAAGASQRHRHFQVVPTPLAPGPDATPIDPLLEHARFDAPLGRAPGLPFLHGLARLGTCQRMSSGEAAVALHGMLREMARAFACDRRGRPYNLLLTRDWMLFVPRTRESWQGISLNALAFAGALLVRSREGLERLRAAGPMTALRHTGVAIAAQSPSRPSSGSGSGP